MDLQSIPRREERLAIARLMVDLCIFWREALSRMDIDREAFFIVPVIFSASLAGRPITRSKICLESAVPPATVDRHLRALMEVGLVVRNVRHYWISDFALANPRGDVDQGVKLVRVAYSRLKIVQNGL